MAYIMLRYISSITTLLRVFFKIINRYWILSKIFTHPLKWSCDFYPSVQFSRSVMSDSLRPHGLQHARSPCPSPTPRVYPNSCPLSRWCYPTICLIQLILCHPLLLPPSIFPSIRVFYNKSVLCIRWPKYWSFSFNISSSNEHSGLISSRMDWLVFGLSLFHLFLL